MNFTLSYHAPQCLIAVILLFAPSSLILAQEESATKNCPMHAVAHVTQQALPQKPWAPGSVVNMEDFCCEECAEAESGAKGKLVAKTNANTTYLNLCQHWKKVLDEGLFAAKELYQYQVVLNTEVSMSDPAAILSQSQSLQLTDEQKTKLAAIQLKAQQESLAILTPDQAARYESKDHKAQSSLTISKSLHQAFDALSPEQRKQLYSCVDKCAKDRLVNSLLQGL